MKLKLTGKKVSLYVTKVIYRLRYLFLRPIRVFCIHQISDVYDPSLCHPIDWLQTSVFRNKVEALSLSYDFISLEEAFSKICKDVFRFRKYAVLTFDDGYHSILESLHWLEKQNIPYSLFLNGKYLDGISMNPEVEERLLLHGIKGCSSKIHHTMYLDRKDILSLSCTIGSHGYEHQDMTVLSEDEVVLSLIKNQESVRELGQCIPFHAYPWGRHSDKSDAIIQKMGIIPVLMDGQKNYNDPRVIHRELFSSALEN